MTRARAAARQRPRRRPPPGRVAPEALAAARGGAVEGLAWLGRPPESKASLLYRLLRLVGRFVLFGVFRFRIRDVRAGAPAAAAATSSSRPRIAAGWTRSSRCTRSRPSLAPGSSAARLDVHVALARAADPPASAGCCRSGAAASGSTSTSPRRAPSSPTAAVFVQMPEGTVSGPPGRIGPFRTGWAVIALRTDAPIVPLAIAGTEELYLGRRLASRVLPATTVRALAGLRAGCGRCPTPGIARGARPRAPDDATRWRRSSARPSRRSTRGRWTRPSTRAGSASG